MDQRATKDQAEHESEHEPSTSAPATESVRDSSADRLLSLQGSIGNRATSLLVAQAKLDIGPADDPFEREADRVADVVVSKLWSRGQRATGDDQDGSGPSTGRSNGDEGRAETLPPTSTLRRAATNAGGIIGLEGGEASEALERSIGSARRGGSPMSADAQDRFGSAFGGADFRNVRLHHGPEATDINRQISASAFTIGNDIFFRGTAPDTGTQDGARLLAHELTHTIQQGASPLAARMTARQVATSAKTTNVQRRGNNPSLAKVLDAGVVVGDDRGGMGQLGHRMDVWVTIDAGTNPATPTDARPNSVYGLEMEYWEWVDQTDNLGTTGQKPWNDIHGMKPDASTFDTDAPAAGIAMTWKKAVDAAKNGTLRGKVKIGFRDLPGLLPKPGRLATRTLKFRIVFNDGNTRKEILATQVLRLQNDRLTYSAYTDSTGNKVESAGFGGPTPVTDTANPQISGAPNRLTGKDVPTKQSIMGTLPRAAMLELRTFLGPAVAGTAAPFVDKEMAEFVKQVPKDRQKGAAEDWMTRISEFLRKDVAEGVAAGQFLVPQISGAKRYQVVVPSGGLLVAVATGKSTPRMYYTDGRVTSVSLDAVPGMGDKHWSVRLRSFTEVPTEMVRQVAEETQVTAPPKDAKVTGDEAAHMRAFSRQGSRYLVDMKKTVGPRLKPAAALKLFQPEVRDATGDWVKVQVDKYEGFIRASKVSGVSATTATAPVPNARADTDAAMNAVIAKAVDELGEGERTYTALMKDYPGYENEIDNAYEKKYGIPSAMKAKALYAAEQQVSVERLMFTLNAMIYDGDPAGMVTAVMSDIRGKPGKGDSFEVAYNESVPALGMRVPATLGEIVSTYFLREFKRDGAVATWNRLNTDFPDFAYRLRPAYRLAWGEDALVAMLNQRERQQLQLDVPDPTGLANTQALQAFKDHAPFQLLNFVPTSGGSKSGKFDARYDPKTNDLVVTIKVFYQFQNASAPEGVTPGLQDAGLGPELMDDKWKESEKQPWKDRYISSATDTWNAGAKRISCVRPGWGEIWVKPRFVIQEVLDESQKHVLVSASKSQLAIKEGKRTLKAGSSGASAGLLLLRQGDVYEKIHDPRLHGYLHEEEDKQNIEPAYNLDRQRLEGVLQRFGKIPLGADRTELQVALRNLSDGLKRLAIPSELASLHPIGVTATTNGDLRKARVVATGIKQRLVALGVPNDITTAAVKGGVTEVVVSTQPVDPAIKRAYITEWERYSAAHEFGHMIGLIDEYYSKTSDETVKEMVSAGWLPPETRTDHFKLHPMNANIAKEAEGQAQLMETLRRTGLESPDFADVQNAMPKTTSLMTGGYQVLDVHMVTMWEALVEMSKGLVDEQHWKIG